MSRKKKKRKQIQQQRRSGGRRKRYGPIYKQNKVTLRAVLMGTCLDGMNCHHIVPFSISRDNSVKNLCYIDITDHDDLHKEAQEHRHINVKGYIKLARKYGAVGIELT